MVYKEVKHGKIACNKSCETGLYLLGADDEDQCVRIVMEETQLRDFIYRLQAMLPKTGQNMNEEKFPIIVTICIAVVLLGGAWAFSWGYVNSWRAVTDKGYIEQQMSGSSQTIWVKPDKAK